MVVVETSYQSNVRRFTILWLGEGLTSFNKNNCVYFSGLELNFLT